MRVVACEVCGEEDDLTGQPEGAAIAVVCGRCGHRWVRDTTPSCRRCGRDDLQAVSRAVWERARGEQLSIVGSSTVYLCPGCDAAELEATDGGRHPQTPDETGKRRH